jgi:hypothetical protein
LGKRRISNIEQGISNDEVKKRGSVGMVKGIGLDFDIRFFPRD